MILLHLVVDGIHENEWIHRLQGTILPSGNFRHDFLCDLRHQFRGDLYVVQFLDLFGDIPLTHPTGVESQNLFFHPVRIPAVLADDLWLKAAVPIPGNLDVHLAKLCFHCLPRVPVAVIGRCV